MATTAQDVLARQIKRNVVLGIVFCFVLSVLICLPAGIGWGQAVAVAVLPAGFAGPFVGGLVSVITWLRAEQRKADAPSVKSPSTADAPAKVAPLVTIALPEMTPTVAAAMALTGPAPTGL